MNIENDTIQQLINSFLAVIPVGGLFRIILCFKNMMGDEDKYSENKRRAKNAAYFVIVAECLMGIVSIVFHYYG